MLIATYILLGLVIAPATTALLLGTVLPLLTGFVTHLEASTATKRVVSLVVALIVVTIRSSVVDGAAILEWATLRDFAIAAATQLAAYEWFWKLVNVNRLLIPTRGIGKPFPPPELPPPPLGIVKDPPNL